MKAGLSEIFGAVSGLMSAGVTLTLNKALDSKDHPIVDLATQAAHKSWNAKRYLLLLDRDPSDEAREKVATEMLSFLKDASDTMLAHQDIILTEPRGKTGKTLAEVRAHVLDMVAREEAGGERFHDKYVAGGQLVAFYNADYSPDYKPPVGKKKSVAKAAPVVQASQVVAPSAVLS